MNVAHSLCLVHNSSSCILRISLHKGYNIRKPWNERTPNQTLYFFIIITIIIFSRTKQRKKMKALPVRRSRRRKRRWGEHRRWLAWKGWFWEKGRNDQESIRTYVGTCMHACMHDFEIRPHISSDCVLSYDPHDERSLGIGWLRSLMLKLVSQRLT